MVGSISIIKRNKTSTISVTAPSNATVTARSSNYAPITSTGSCSLEIRSLGLWTVICTCDGVEKSTLIYIGEYNKVYAITFTFTSTITISCPYSTCIIRASLIDSSSAGTGISRTGPGDIEVSEIGTWMITCTYNSLTKTEYVTVTRYGAHYNVSFT